jgi:hypothetical protein
MARSIMADAVRSQAAILIGDLSPNRGGVLFNGALTAMTFTRMLPGILIADPLKMLLIPALPLVFFAAVHDATVSVMRAYSEPELADMLSSVPGGKEYTVRTFNSASFAAWLGVPALVGPLNDPVLQFVLCFPSQFANDTAINPVTKITPTPASIARSVSAVNLMQWWGQVLALGMFLLAGWRLRVGSQRKEVCRRAHAAHGREGKPAILAIGTANPPFKCGVSEFNKVVDDMGAAGTVSEAHAAFITRMNSKSGISSRYYSFPVEQLPRSAVSDVAARHALWAEWAPKLSLQAARAALKVNFQKT